MCTGGIVNKASLGVVILHRILLSLFLQAGDMHARSILTIKRSKTDLK